MDGINHKILSRYIPIANFIADMYGPSCEVAIHDLSNLKNSIVYITEPSITGRALGDPITDYALKLFREKRYESEDFIVNYLGCSSNSDQALRASTYFIKEKGELVGLLCVNVDISNMLHAKQLIEQSMLVDMQMLSENSAQEHFHLSLEEVIENTIEEYTEHNGILEFHTDDKRAITHRLERNGIFLIKGAISLVALKLDVSEQTIYRYLRDTAREATDNERKGVDAI